MIRLVPRGRKSLASPQPLPGLVLMYCSLLLLPKISQPVQVVLCTITHVSLLILVGNGDGGLPFMHSSFVVLGSCHTTDVHSRSCTNRASTRRVCLLQVQVSAVLL